MNQQTATTTRKVRKPAKVTDSTPVAGARIGRLSDPDVKPRIQQAVKDLTSSKEKSIEFLKEIGMLTKAGHLASRYKG